MNQKFKSKTLAKLLGLISLVDLTFELHLMNYSWKPQMWRQLKTYSVIFCAFLVKTEWDWTLEAIF